MDKEVVERGMVEAKRLRDGGVPNSAELAMAPFMTDWLIESLPDGMFRLAGECTGHPSIRDGWVHTSPVLAIADDLTWMRTVSRYYRLGTRWQQLLDKLEGS